MIAKWYSRIEASVRSKGSKLIALLLAVITWYAIQPAISFETTIRDLPVRILVDGGWAVLEQSATGVDVHFRGSREGIRYLRQEELEVVADARGMAYGDSLSIPLDLRSVRAPSGVRPVFIRPAEITLTVDQEEDRLLPVRVHIQGAPPEGYEIEAFSAQPAKVMVSGPRQRLETVDAIRTTPIDMEGRLQSFRLRVGLVSPSRAWTARMDPERVDVDVTLVERASSRVFEDVRVKTLFGPIISPEVEIQPTHVHVEVVGRSDLLESLSPKDFSVYVELTGLDPDESHQLPLRVHLPPRIRVERMEPGVVSVRLIGTDVQGRNR